MHNHNKSVIPEKFTGVHNDTTSRIKCANVKQAELLFISSAKRLLDVNKWQEYSGRMLSHFRLKDKNGNSKNDFARVHDHILIDIPGPGSKAGDGEDWVRIEEIAYHETDQVQHMLAMRVRPAKHPSKSGKKVAHFFQEHATSTFLLIQNGVEVTCAVVGRNEKPNVKSISNADKIRNFFTAIIAMIGFSKLQWKYLTKGILSYN